MQDSDPIQTPLNLTPTRLACLDAGSLPPDPCAGEPQPANPGRRAYAVRFIQAGRVRAAGNRDANLEVPAGAIRQAVAEGKFDGRASFLDHAGQAGICGPDYPSLRNLVGITGQARWDETSQSAEGVIRLYEGPAAALLAELLDGILADRAGGRPAPDVGLSLVFWPRWEPAQDPGGPRRLAAFRHIESIDFVFEPAAGGRVMQALSACRLSAQPEPIQLTHIPTGGAPTMETPTNTPTLPADPAQDPAETTLAGPAAASAPGETAAAWMDELSRAAAQAILQASGLPAPSRERLGSRSYRSPSEVDAAVEAERSYLARLSEDRVVQLGGLAPRGGSVQAGLSGYDQLRLAAEALLAGERPAQGVPPLSGIRELYTLLSGDYEMTGMFHEERVRFANVTSATMAGLVADALNKRVVKLFRDYPQWWEPLVTAEDFTSLQQVKWITLGGVGELPTVAEGAAYGELTWDDQTETSDFVKKGGYLGITIEAIDKDDTRKLQAAPRALAQSAWLTLGKAVAAIFTGNAGAGPVMSDGTNLFAAAHSNLGANALSYAEFKAVRAAMRKQTELNSGERLGALASPKYLLVPPDLEGAALEILATEQAPSQANWQENIFAEGSGHDARLDAARRRVIVVDLWTDANDWAAAADPLLYPSIGLGYRYGRTPEIFSVASPTAGLMFTNDTLPIKVRFFFAVGPVDWRGLYKSNVV